MILGRASSRPGRIELSLFAFAALGLPALSTAAPTCYDVECDLGCSSSWTGRTRIVSPSDFPTEDPNTPIAFVDPADGLPHRFIATREGRIWVWDGATDSIRETPFLDLTVKVHVQGNELGMVAVAVDPDYVSTGELYVLYTGRDQAPGDDDAIVIERYRRDPGNPEQGLVEAETILVVDHRGGVWHHGGSLVFGRDGMLYVSLGDGGGACDQVVDGSPHGQRLDSLLGKILRLDVRAVEAKGSAPECGGPGSSYGVPPSNPLAGGDANCGEIWAYGLRNPYRMTADTVTGDLWIGDVGQESWEEIDFLPGDYQPESADELRNFGWKCREGCSTLTCANEISLGGPLCPDTLAQGITECSYSADADPSEGVLELWDPVLCHENRAIDPENNDWQAIVGGYRYRGWAIPELAGSYLYGDVYCGQIWKTTSFDKATPAAATSACLDAGNQFLTSFAQDRFGELYLVFGDGRIICLHDGSGCFWADDAGLFEDGFETGDSRRWTPAPDG